MVAMLVSVAVASLIAVPVVPAVVARIGKKNAFSIGAAGFVLLGVWVFVMPASMPALVVTCLLLGFCQGMTMSLLFAFEADTVEYGYHLTGDRTEGATYAVYSFFRKVAQALAGAFVAYALSLGGSDASLPTQSEEALTAIRAAIGLGPAVFALLGALMFVAYPLTDDRLREIIAERGETPQGSTATQE